MSRLRRPSRSVLMVAVVLLALAAAIAASGCDVGGDTPAGEADAPEAAVGAGEHVSDQAQTPPEPSGDGNTPPPDTAAAALPTLDPPDADEGSDAAGGLVQRVIGTVSPLVGFLIGVFTGDETIEIGAVCSNRFWASDDVPWSDTPEDCRRAEEGGIHAGAGWTWEFWGAGFENRTPDTESAALHERWLIDADAIVASLNDGPPIAFNDSAFHDALTSLPPGQHTVRVNEWRGDGEWSGWTQPYVFTLVVDLEIAVVCNLRTARAVDECGEGGTTALHTGAGWDWDARVRGMRDWAATEFRFDGGPAFLGGSNEDYDAFDALAPGRHTIEARERRPWGWTDWSAPYEFETVAVLEIVAICNARANREVGEWQHPATAADCRAVGAAGLRTGSGWDWQLYTRGGVEQASTVYRFDGGAEFRGGSDEDYAAFDALAPGRHTITARERRPWGWTDWSAPYEFETVAVLEVTAICSARWDRALSQWQHPASAADCRAVGAAGLRTGSGWDWQLYTRGGVERANIIYRFDGGSAFRGGSDEDHAAFDALAPGHHTIGAREQRPWGWTEWSAPYEFETVAVLEIVAICNARANREVGEWQHPATAADCRAAAADGLRIGIGWDWQPHTRGGVERANITYRFDGGEEFTLDGTLGSMAFATLASGRHTIQAREQRPWGWTDWSAPYAFTVVRLVDEELASLDPSDDEGTDARNGSDPASRWRVIGAQSSLAGLPIEAFTGDETRTIWAFCNGRWDRDREELDRPEIPEECRGSAMAGIHVGRSWIWEFFGEGFEWIDPSRLVVSIDDGAPLAADDPAFPEAMNALAPGHHTIRVNHWGGQAWAGWTAPYGFTTIADLEIVAICSVPSDPSPTYAECKAAEGRGFDTQMGHWAVIADGVWKWANMVFRFDSKTGTSEEDVWSLPPGTHTVKIREQRPWGWTDWSPPYTFTVR